MSRPVIHARPGVLCFTNPKRLRPARRVGNVRVETRTQALAVQSMARLSMVAAFMWLIR